MAIRANFHGDLWHSGMAGESSVTTEASYLGLNPIWMDIRFHNLNMIPEVTRLVNDEWLTAQKS
jgi:hypothetical protein